MSEPPLKVGAEGVEIEPKKTGHRKVDLIVAGAAILISVVSLAVAVKHGLIMERLVAANSWPLLSVSSSNLDDAGNQAILLEIKNAGIGPAIVREFSVGYKGRRYSSPYELLKACCGYSSPGALGTRFSRGGVITGTVEDSVVRAGEAATYLRIDYTDQNSAFWSRLDRERFGFSYDACYCSAFDDCWRSQLTNVDPTPVDSCPAG